MHLVQCMNASSTVTTSTNSGTRPATSSRSRSHPSRAMRAVPLTLSVSPFPGTRKIRPNSGLLQHVAKRVSAQVAGALGDRDRPTVQHVRESRGIALWGDIDAPPCLMRGDDDEWRPGDERQAYVVEGVHDLIEHAWVRPAKNTLQPFRRGDEFGQGRIVRVWGHPDAFRPLRGSELGLAYGCTQTPSACGADVVVDTE